MEQGRVERRKGRRVGLEVPLQIRQAGGRTAGAFQEEQTKNISLAGAYFETEDEQAYAVNEFVITSVSIPVEQRRAFPFTRLAGRSRVVRVNELPSEQASGRKRYGIALEFGDDFTALAALPQ